MWLVVNVMKQKKSWMRVVDPKSMAQKIVEQLNAIERNYGPIKQSLMIEHVDDVYAEVVVRIDDPA